MALLNIVFKYQLMFNIFFNLNLRLFDCIVFKTKQNVNIIFLW